MKALRAFLLLASVTLSSWAYAANTCDAGFAAFEKSVYVKVRKDCVGCHSGRRPDVPAFAVADSRRSYDTLLNYMNFTKIEDSLLVFRAGNGHCGDDVCEGDSGEEMKMLATQWWQQGENTCGRNGTHFSSEVVLPQLPNQDAGYKTITLPLNNISSDLMGVSLQIDVQNYEPAGVVRGAYRIKSPRLVGSTKPLKVKDIKILLNGKYDPVYNAFTTVDRVVNFFPVEGMDHAMASTVLAAQPLIILKDSLANPKLSASFVTIEAAESPEVCMNSEVFMQTVMPLLDKYQCKSCHNSTGQGMGSRVFDGTQPANRICENVTNMLDKKFFMASPVVAFPTRGVHGHMQLTDAQKVELLDTLRAWSK